MYKKKIPNYILLSEVRKIIQSGQRVTLKVKGNSMLPFIRGDKDYVQLAAVEELLLGDVILAEVSSGKFCLHRLVKIHGDELVMMGDGNLSGYEYCHYTDVIGKVISVIHENGKETNCNSSFERCKALWWYRCSFFRRFLLFIWKKIFL